MVHQAFLLAAGLGTRMRPITDTLPKSMISVAGRSMIYRMLDQLIDYGVTKIVINAFYKKELLKEHIALYFKEKSAEAIDWVVLEESELLETGGGVLNALEHLNDGEFFVVNTDSIFEGENIFSFLSQRWNDSMKCLFALVDKQHAVGYSGRGDFNITSRGSIACPSTFDSLPYVYPGVHISSTSLFKNRDIKPIKLMKIYDEHKQQDGTYTGMHGAIYNGKWYHVGTPHDLGLAEQLLGDSNELQLRCNRLDF